MPRSASGIYTLPSGSFAVSGDVANPDSFNDVLRDLQADANAIRPVGSGGTGVTSYAALKTALSLSDLASKSQVATADIADDAVTESKIADNAVGTSQVINASITGAKIAAATITNGHYADGQITGNKIAAATITRDKLLGVSGVVAHGRCTDNGTLYGGQIGVSGVGHVATGQYRVYLSPWLPNSYTAIAGLIYANTNNYATKIGNYNTNFFDVLIFTTSGFAVNTHFSFAVFQ